LAFLIELECILRSWATARGESSSSLIFEERAQPQNFKTKQ
jgi:hypothetical protein